MTLREIANSSYSDDDTANGDGDGSDQIAIINCNNKKGNASAFGRWPGDDTSRCNHPSFQLNRNMITLPFINQTADKIYDRMNPSPNGDYNLVNDVVYSLNIPEYNMTITGLPVAIARGLSAAEAIGGTVVPLDPTNNITQQTSPPGSVPQKAKTATRSPPHHTRRLRNFLTPP